MINLKKDGLVIITILILIFIFYFKAIDYFFVGEEFDVLYGFEITGIKDTLKHFYKPVGSLNGGDFSYRPLWNIVFCLIYYSPFKFNPIAYRIITFLLHFSNVLLIYYIIKKIFDFKYAALISILYTIHPITIEPVLWWNASADLFWQFFFLCAFYFHIQNEDYKSYNYFLVSLFLILALLSKENGILFLGFASIFDFVYFKRDNLLKKLKKIIKRNVHIFLIICIYFIFRLFIFDHFGSYGSAPKYDIKLITIVVLRRLRVCLFYALKFYKLELASEQIFIIYIILFIFLFLIFIYFYKKIIKIIDLKFLLLNFLFFIYFILPTSNICTSLRTSDIIIGARFMYFPLIFMLIILIYLIFKINCIKIRTTILIVLFIFWGYKNYYCVSLFKDAADFGLRRWNNIIKFLKEEPNMEKEEIYKKILAIEEGFEHKSSYSGQTAFLFEQQFYLIKNVILKNNYNKN